MVDGIALRVASERGPPKGVVLSAKRIGPVEGVMGGTDSAIKDEAGPAEGVCVGTGGIGPTEGALDGIGKLDGVFVGTEDLGAEIAEEFGAEGLGPTEGALDGIGKPGGVLVGTED